MYRRILIRSIGKGYVERKLGETQLCNLPEVTVEQMTFGRRGQVGRPTITDKKIHKGMRVRNSVLEEIGNRKFTQFFEECYMSSKTIQPGAYTRTNYHRSLESNLSTMVASIISDNLLQPSVKTSALMSGISSIVLNNDGTSFIISGP